PAANANRMAGYLARIDYNDAAGEIPTPGLTFDYDRRGRGRTVTQNSALPITTTLSWHPAGPLNSESYSGSFLDTLSVVAGNVDGAILRRASLDVRKLGVTIGGTAVSYGYDNASRLQTLSSANPAGTGFSATYAYAPNSHLVNTVTFQQTTPSPVTRLTTTSQYDFLNRLQSINPVA